MGAFLYFNLEKSSKKASDFIVLKIRPIREEIQKYCFLIGWIFKKQIK
jgi:hypothetical protein